MIKKGENTMDGFVPVSIAAERSNYSISMVYKMIERNLVEVRDFYGRKLVNLAGVLDYRQRMQSLGAAKHIPCQYREDDTEVEAEVNPTPEAV